MRGRSPMNQQRMGWHQRTGVIVALLVLARVAPTLAQPSPDDTGKAKAAFRSALLHYNLGEYGEAMAKFKEAYQLHPHAVYLFNIGQCSRQLGDPAAAAKAYRSYLREL